MLRWIKLEQTVEVEPISHDAILMDQHQGKHPEYKTSNYWMFCEHVWNRKFSSV